MANEAPKRLIPKADAERMQIVVRRSEQQRLFCYGGEPPTEPNDVPADLSYREVIGWIAYGQITALDCNVPGTAQIYGRWGEKILAGRFDAERRHPLVHAFRHVVARERWSLRNKRQNRSPDQGWLRPLENGPCADVCWAMQHHNGNAKEVLALLLEDLRQLRKAELVHSEKVDRARRQLHAYIADGQIVARGLPGISRKLHFDDQMLEPVPPEFLSNANNTIRLDNWATCTENATGDTWVNWKGKEWGNVQFKRSDVFRLWPPSEPHHVDLDGTTDCPPPVLGGAHVETRPAFTYKRAEVLLIAKKAGKEWSNRPTATEARAFLELNFINVTRDPVRKLLQVIWGEGKRGPRKKRLAAK